MIMSNDKSANMGWKTIFQGKSIMHWSDFDDGSISRGNAVMGY